MDYINEIVLATVLSAGGIGGIIIAIVKLSVANIEKRIERKYTEKFTLLQADVEKKKYISQVRFDAEFGIYRNLSQKYGELVLKIVVTASNISEDKQSHRKERVEEVSYLAYQAVSELYASAPFIQEEIYNEFVAIYEMSRRLLVWWSKDNIFEEGEFLDYIEEANIIYQKYNDIIRKVRDYTSRLEVMVYK